MAKKTEAPERLVPNSPEAEEAVLGSILICPDVLVDLADIVAPADFFLVKNDRVYQVLLRLFNAREAIDNLTVIEVLGQIPESAKKIPDTLKPVPPGDGTTWLDSVGGSAYITYLINNTPTHIHAETYARIVKRAAIRRRLFAAASDIANIALQENWPIEKVLSTAESTLFGVTNTAESAEIEPVSAVTARLYDDVAAMHTEQKAMLGIPTGYHALDRLLSGLQRKRLHIIAAPTRVGKTTFMLHLAMNQARLPEPIPSLFLSLEMDRQEIVTRMVASAFNLDTQKLQLGDLNEQEWKSFTDGLADVEHWPIYLDDTPDLDPARLKRLIRRWQHEAGIQVVYIDYLQLMESGRRFKGGEREQEITYICRSLKKVAMTLDIPLVLCAQLSRKVEDRADKKPQLSDLRESGSIEHTADVVMFIYRDDLYHENSERPNQADIIIAKHRNGPTGVIPLYFHKEYTQFSPLQTGTINLREGYGEPAPQQWPTPPPRRTAPILLGDGFGEKEQDE